MRSWNFTTLDQILETVTAIGGRKDRQAIRRGFRPRASLPAALIFTAGMLCATAPASQIQPRIHGTPEFITVPMGHVDSSERPKPPYIDKFSSFFTDDFVRANAAGLAIVRMQGSSKDSMKQIDGIVAAINAGADKMN